MEKSQYLRGTLKRIIFALILISSMTFTTGCYTVKIVNKNGVAEGVITPNPGENGFYRDKKFHEYKTWQKGRNAFHQPDDCDNGFYAIEYKVGLGPALLSTVTFGACKRVKVKYVCNK